MTVVCRVLSSHLTDCTPKHGHHTFPCLHLWSQRHWPTPCQIVCEHWAMILIMALASAFYAPHLFLRFWPGRPILFQTLISKHRFCSCAWICWTPNLGSCISVSRNLIIISNASARVEIFCCDNVILKCGDKDATNT